MDRLERLQLHGVGQAAAEWHPDHRRVPADQELPRCRARQQLLATVEQSHVGAEDPRVKRGCVRNPDGSGRGCYREKARNQDRPDNLGQSADADYLPCPGVKAGSFVYTR